MTAPIDIGAEVVAGLATAISPDAYTATGEPNLLLAISDRALTVIDDVLADCGDNTPSLLASNIAAVLAPTITDYLTAVGLPALLERVEAAEGVIRQLEATNMRDRERLALRAKESTEARNQRYALAAKVADAGATALADAADALRNDWVENGKHQGLPGCYSTGYETWLRRRARDLRAALTEGNEG